MTPDVAEIKVTEQRGALLPADGVNETIPIRWER